ncbi:MAG: lysylphosphatidylglycerol synthase transmembrane domain-containing protein [Gemmatimonadota bacterium]
MTTGVEPARAPAGVRSRGNIVRLAVGIVVSLGLLWWSFRGVPLAEAAAHVRSAHLAPLLGAVILATITFPIRVARWRLLLRRDDGSALPPGPMWHAVAIGFMANNVLPFRAGELLRAYAVNRLSGARVSAAISSIGVERVFDGLTVVALLACALLSPGMPSDLMIAGQRLTDVAQVAALACGVLLLAAATVLTLPDLTERIIRALIPARHLANRLVAIVAGLRHGLGVLRSPARVATVVCWSFVLWMTNAAAFWLAYRAFDITVAYPGALVMQAALVFGIAVPSTPGFVGVFEAVIKAVLNLFGVDDIRAVAYAVTYHVTTFLPITVLGLWSLWHTPIALRDARQPAPPA